MQAPGCASPGKDHADSVLVVLMEGRKPVFGGLQDVWREGNGSSSCQAAKGRGCPPPPRLLEICRDMERTRSLLDCLPCQGWGSEMNRFFSSQGWQELEIIESC